MMYTLEELNRKNFAELKKIGYELNVLPKGDRRCRQSWIDALVPPPLLQLLEGSPATSVEQVQEVIVQATETSPGVDVEPVSEEIAPAATSLGVDVAVSEAIVQAAETSPGAEVDRVSEVPCEYPRNARRDCPCCGGIQSLYQSRNFCMESWVIRCLYCDYERLKDPRCAYLAAPEPVHGPDEYPWKKEAILQAIAYPPPPPGYTPTRDHCSPLLPIAPSTQTFSGVDSFREQIEPVAETSPGAEVDRVQKPIVETVETSPAASVEQAQEPIALAAETLPGVNLDDELPGCCNCFGDGDVEDEFGFVKFCQCETEPKLSHQRTQRAIEKSVEKSPGVDCVYCHAPEYEYLRDESYRCYKCKPEPDQNPILTGVSFSDRFLATYPPYFGEIRYKAEVTGQLNLLEPVTNDEPPDPDDFESLDAFREAIERWDLEHPSSSDHCSDLPNSVHSDPLEVSLDSFCEWAPCPAGYELAALLDPSKVMELSPVHKNSSTSDFFIPTFNCWGDRSNRSDEPPDTGIFARLPKPKPPNFPPQSASWTQVGHKLDTSQSGIPKLSRNYPETIPKLFHRVAAGSSTQPARSPPGGDAMS